MGRRRVHVVVNPRAGGGEGGRRLGALSAALGRHLDDWELHLTGGPREATTLVREAVRRGATTIVSVGGDGTHHEVTQALMEPAAQGVELGVLHAGTGGDFRRNLRHATWDAALAAMVSLPPRLIDVGEAQYVTDAGVSAATWFLNVASAGLSGSVDRAVNAGSKTFGGTASFILGTLQALRHHRAPQARVTLDGVVVHDGALHLALACNGRWAGGGMMFAPEARLDDGLLDLLLLRGDRLTTVLRAMPDVYRGAHLRHPEVLLVQGREVVIDTHDEALLDLDGESPGRAPVTFRVHPSRIPLLGLA